MKVAYVRVSTTDQNADRQMDALKKYDIEKWYIEKESAKDTERPEFKKMREFVRNGDIVYIHDYSRLARNVKDLLEIVDEFEKKGVQLVNVKESIDTGKPYGKMVLTILGAIYEFERACILERQREGIESAKRRGAYARNGRKPKAVDEKFLDLYESYMKREVNKREFAEKLGVSRPTLDKLIKDHESKKHVD